LANIGPCELRSLNLTLGAHSRKISQLSRFLSIDSMLLFAIFADDVLNAIVGETVGSTLGLKGSLASRTPVKKLRLGCFNDFTRNLGH
jgi:hypothetical protein